LAPHLVAIEWKLSKLMSLFFLSIVVIVIYDGVHRLWEARTARLVVLAGFFAAAAGILMEGSNAYALRHLANQIPRSESKPYKELSDSDLAAMQAAHRADLSAKWASAAYVNTGQVLRVLDDSGHTTLYRPDEQDVKAREATLTTAFVARAKRDEVEASADAALMRAEVWLTGSFLAFIAGLVAAFIRRRGRGS
jgi:hypothetical protein